MTNSNGSEAGEEEASQFNKSEPGEEEISQSDKLENSHVEAKFEPDITMQHNVARAVAKANDIVHMGLTRSEFDSLSPDLKRSIRSASTQLEPQIIKKRDTNASSGEGARMTEAKTQLDDVEAADKLRIKVVTEPVMVTVEDADDADKAPPVGHEALGVTERASIANQGHSVVLRPKAKDTGDRK
ncbi:hypothetical protein P7C71_g5986, partial [Lecanoromycetidae sp. Uapishka_2]